MEADMSAPVDAPDTQFSGPAPLATNSVNENIKHFVNNTKLSDSGEPYIDHDTKEVEDALNEFNLSININKQDLQEMKERTHKKNFKYMANQDFHMSNNDTADPNSLPNTFKNKSYPNAKTKSQLGLYKCLNDTKIPESDSFTELGPMKTSTLDKTPNWMPPELQGERWDDEQNEVNELQSSVRITKNPSLNFQLPSTNNSIIHNSKTSHNETPEWKKATKGYENNKKYKLQQVFLADDKSHMNSNSISLDLSTPYNSIKHSQEHQRFQDSDKNFLDVPSQNASPLKLFGPDYDTYTKDKLIEVMSRFSQPPVFGLDNVQNSKIVERPSEEEEEDRGEGLQDAETHEDQLTKDIDIDESLTEVDAEEKDEFIDQISDKDDISTNEFTSKVMPKMKTRTIENDIESKFKQKANSLFDNLQKRGGFLQPSRAISMANTAANNTAVNASGTTATATSTPKLNRVTNIDEIDNVETSNEYSSFTSGFDEESTQFQNLSVKNNQTNSDDYTSFTHSGSGDNTEELYSEQEQEMRSDMEGEQELRSDTEDMNPDLKGPNHLNQTFSYEKVSDIEEPESSAISSSPNASVNKELQERVNYLEAQLSSVESLRNHMEILIDENQLLKDQLQNKSPSESESQVWIDDYDISVDQAQEDFKMKRVSQLKLQNANSLNSPSNRGMLKPSTQFPNTYENMVLDEANHRWILKENKENVLTSLDEIEDLVSDNDRLNDAANVSTGKKEVSFHLPHSEHVKSSPNHYSSDEVNVTRASQIDEISYSEQQKDLVSVITNNLMYSEEDWRKVTVASFVKENLNSVMNLLEFLPNLLKLDLSDNHIKFLKGIPKGILNLNVSLNQIDNLTSFTDLVNLQTLSLSNNNLNNCFNLTKNIHLTKLSVTNNHLTSLDGLNKLSNLISLDVSMNKLDGIIDFLNFNFENLQEIRLSDNKIKAVKLLEKLPNLRILDLNNNELSFINSSIKHRHLKKLLLKYNDLETIDVNQFPYLRVLRIDGNRLESFRGNLKYLEELSAKGQENFILEKLLNSKLDQVKKLDLSGNNRLFEINWNLLRFPNVNQLTLSGLDVDSLPEEFYDIFPNITELNLNFNKLKNLDQLRKYKYLKKVYLLSNNLSRIETVIKNLGGSRNTLKILDLRLNTMNNDLYPSVFYLQEDNKLLSPDFTNVEMLENFSIHYQALDNKQELNDWDEREEIFSRNLSKNKKHRKADYLTLLINYFPKLKKLDGTIIDSEKRLEYEAHLDKRLSLV